MALRLRSAPPAVHHSAAARCRQVKCASSAATASRPAKPHQHQPAALYVNLEASTADYERVLARLAANGQGPAPTPVSATTTAPKSAHAAPAPWGGLLGGLLGGLRGGGSDAHDLGDSNGPLTRALVMFTATWCGPCSVAHREVAAAAGRLGGEAAGARTAVLVIDVEANKELASQLGIKSLPTLLFFGSDHTRGPIFRQGVVSAAFIMGTLERAEGFGGSNTTAKWLKL